MDSGNLIRELGLQPHPEGGYYKETYRSTEHIRTGDGKERNVSTAIFYLLQNNEKSNFHRIKSDEMWFFHQGQAFEIFWIHKGKMNKTILGNNLAMGEVPQTVIPANTWFASRVKDGKGYALASCVVAPGFDFADFELAKRSELQRLFPALEEIISDFTSDEQPAD